VGGGHLSGAGGGQARADGRAGDGVGGEGGEDVEEARYKSVPLTPPVGTQVPEDWETRTLKHWG
jgi:hypothetical protein